MTVMMLPVSPAAEPTPSVNSIRKNSTANNCRTNRIIIILFLYLLFQTSNVLCLCLSPLVTVLTYLRHPVELGEGVRVGDEGQTRAAPHHVLHIRVELVGEVAEDAEDGESGEQGGQRVGQADDPGISVRGKRYFTYE